MKPVTIDFETHGIEPRPDYPPVPVGVAIKRPGRKAKYYAWGHRTDNNCTHDDALAALRAVWNKPLLFHNAKFDLDVAETHLSLPPPPWDRVHDTTFLLFLDDPHVRTVALKPSAERLLGQPPEERDVVADWLIANQPVPGVKITPGGKQPWAKYIAWAPGSSIVDPYACGDVDRTAALFTLLHASVLHERGMGPAYDRERRLAPILLDMERRGVPVDLPLLRADVTQYSDALARAETWVLRRLGRARTPLNLDSGEQLVAALVDAGKADPALMGVTAKEGKVRTDKAALAAGVTDRQLAAVLRYAAQLRTCLRTFMEPWLVTAERSKGKIYTTWNQTRGENGGTRTGRLSSSPNWQNIPKEFDPIKLPAALILPPLPLCRGYIVAPRGHTLCDRDFASQELRVLAHFEDAAMKQSYIDDPATDFHQFAADMISKITSTPISRRAAKTISFALLYGAGRPKLAAQLKCTIAEADQLLSAYFTVFPGIRDVQKGLRDRAAMGQPICTAGGRKYLCEPPRLVDGQMREFSYKLLNYLVQGSSADQTKDAMIRFYDSAGPGFLLASVHDELLLAAPTRGRKHYMALLKTSMEDAGLDVPMLSDGRWGRSWSTLERSPI